MFNPRNALFHLTACHDGTVILAHLFEKLDTPPPKNSTPQRFHRSGNLVPFRIHHGHGLQNQNKGVAAPSIHPPAKCNYKRKYRITRFID
jgi:hypothetical protein